MVSGDRFIMQSIPAPISTAKPNATNNKFVRVQRLRAIAALVKARKNTQAWHALIAWAEKEEAK